eukprot:419196_1
MFFILVAIIIYGIKASSGDDSSSDKDKNCGGTLRLCDRAEIHDLFVTNFALRDDATLDNGDPIDRQKRLNEYETFLNTFYADDVRIVSSQNPSNPTVGKENAINLVISSMSASRNIRHISGGLKYDFVSSNEATVRETHRTTGYLPDFSSFPPGPPQWFRGDDTHFFTFKNINGVWKLKQLISNPRVDEDLIQQQISAKVEDNARNIDDTQLGENKTIALSLSDNTLKIIWFMAAVFIIGVLMHAMIHCFWCNEKQMKLRHKESLPSTSIREIV